MQFILFLLVITTFFSETLSTVFNPATSKNFPFTIDFSGYVRHLTFWDTRQTDTEREGEFVFSPLPQLLDARGEDINAKGQFNMLDMRTRVKLNILGPTIGHAKSRGYLESDFYGKTNLPNIFRLYRAFFELTWNKKLIVLMGQDDNPMFLSNYKPHTVTINEGAPFHPHGRNPQIAVTYHAGPLDIIGTVVTQLDSVSSGPIGTSTTYLRDAIVPQLNFQLHWHPDHAIVLGANVDFKRMVPRLVTNNNIKVTEHINSVSTIAFIHMLWENRVRIASKFTYSQNQQEYKMFSGYAVSTIDPITDERTYTNLAVWGWWFDIECLRWKNVQPGFFVAFTKNLGSRSSIVTDAAGAVRTDLIFARTPKLDHQLRVSPRVYWYISSFTIAAEVEITHASFGTINSQGKINNSIGVTNVRPQCALFYNF